MSSGTWSSPWYSELYDAVTAQLEHEFDVLGYDGNAEGIESLERIRTAVSGVNARRHAFAEQVVKP